MRPTFNARQRYQIIELINSYNLPYDKLTQVLSRLKISVVNMKPLPSDKDTVTYLTRLLSASLSSAKKVETLKSIVKYLKVRLLKFISFSFQRSK